MVRFSPPPKRGSSQPYFPGIAPSSFDPSSASVCYLENIRKENDLRSNFRSIEGGQQRAVRRRLADTFGDSLPGLANINATYATRGWRLSVGTGRWMPPMQSGEDLDLGEPGASAAPSLLPRVRSTPQISLHSIGGGGTLLSRRFQPADLMPSPSPGLGSRSQEMEDVAAPTFHSTWRTPVRGTWRSESERDLGTAGSRLEHVRLQARAIELVRQRCGGRKTGADITWC